MYLERTHLDLVRLVLDNTLQEVLAQMLQVWLDELAKQIHIDFVGEAFLLIVRLVHHFLFSLMDEIDLFISMLISHGWRCLFRSLLKCNLAILKLALDAIFLVGQLDFDDLIVSIFLVPAVLWNLTGGRISLIADLYRPQPFPFIVLQGIGTPSIGRLRATSWESALNDVELFGNLLEPVVKDRSQFTRLIVKNIIHLYDNVILIIELLNSN